MDVLMLVLARIATLAVLGAVAWLVVVVGRRYVEARREAALRAAPLLPAGVTGDGRGESAQIRILAFSSDDCVQCHRMQTPALARVQEARPNTIAVEEIDAPSSPELASRYHVLTVPTTVVLDRAGRAHAVNYGFASTSKLLEQVDAVAAAGLLEGRSELRREPQPQA